MRTFVEAIIITTLAACLVTCFAVGGVMAYEPCYIVSRPIEVQRTGSIPMIVDAPMRQVIRSYESPVILSVCSDVQTSVYAVERVPTEVVVVDRRPLTPLQNERIVVPLEQIVFSSTSEKLVPLVTTAGMERSAMTVAPPATAGMERSAMTVETPVTAGMERSAMTVAPPITAGMERSAMTVETDDVADTDLFGTVLLDTRRLPSRDEIKVVTRKPEGQKDAPLVEKSQPEPIREEVRTEPTTIHKGDTLQAERSEPVPAWREPVRNLSDYVLVDMLDIPDRGDVKTMERVVPPPMSTTVLGQVSPGFSGAADEVMSQRPPLPDGPADLSSIPKVLLDAEEPTLSESSQQGKPVGPDAGERDHRREAREASAMGGKVNGALWIVTIASIMMTIYVLVIAYDYYQRWIQSLTMQNRRYALPWEDDSSLGTSYTGFSDYYGDIQDYSVMPDDSFTDRFGMDGGDTRNYAYRSPGR